MVKRAVTGRGPDQGHFPALSTEEPRQSRALRASFSSSRKARCVYELQSKSGQEEPETEQRPLDKIDMHWKNLIHKYRAKPERDRHDQASKTKMKKMAPYVAVALLSGTATASLPNVSLVISPDFTSAVTIVALLLALTQTYSTRRTQNTTKVIAESLSTRYVDVFPENLDEIIDLLKTTRHKLVVMTDVVGYGIYSCPRLALEYQHQLLALQAKDVDMALIVYDRYTTEVAIRKQMKTISNIDKEKETASWAEYFRVFPGQNRPQTLDEFFHMLTDHHGRLLNELRLHWIQVREIPIAVPLFVWVSDEKTAIFSFYTEGGKNREVSFRTKDDRLISTLREMTHASIPEASSEEDRGLQSVAETNG